jgi:hypothetical protein
MHANGPGLFHARRRNAKDQPGAGRYFAFAVSAAIALRIGLE